MYWATGEYDFITADLKENGVLRITLDDQKDEMRCLKKCS